MKRSVFLRCQMFIGLIVLSALIATTFGSANASTTQISDPPSDQVAVKLKPGVAINTILARYNATLLGTVTETNFYFLELLNGQTASQLLPQLNADPDLYYAEPNYYADGTPDGGVILLRAHMAPMAEVILLRAHGELTPTPPGNPDQWAWNKIGLADAQKISTGQGIIIAVLDTGLAADHSLLRSSIAAGYDFVGMSNSIYDTGNGLDDDGDGIIDEDLGHGTHVSGIILTEAPGVQIMPIRVLNSDGVGTYWEVAAGIRFAVDHGAKIINMSLSAPRLTPSLADALNYAASRGVLVVGAAGTGSGPNYPAAYSGVIGVGASDQNDAVAWFSGGQAADNDVFAPGVDIYSAFPYNNYALGSGTSMAAPMVSAEAALLMSRYPDWSPSKVIQRVLEKTAPITGATARRIDLAAALSTGLAVEYMANDTGAPNDNNIKPRIKIVNNTAEAIPLSQIKLRYWYTSDSNQPQTFNCDFASVGCGNLTGVFVQLPDNSLNKTTVSDTSLEIGFAESAGSLAAGGWTEMYLRFNKNDWSNYTEANDYSFDASRMAPGAWDRITLSRNGGLIWGVEPARTTSSATATLAPATSAPTRTSTPIPTSTAQPSKTSTPVPQLPTKTATPTTTKTSAPATSTPATSPASSIKLKYMPGTAASSSQAISPYLSLFNSGTASIPLNQIKIRYWFTVDGDKPQSYWCDYSSLGCGNITAQFVPLTVSRAGADYYLEIGFTSAAGSLAPGANTGQIQSRFSKNDWSAYTQTGDYSFDPFKTQLADWTKITVYQNGVLIWGIEP
ncbi:MAG: hypothetical protein CVU44_01615 [Chloroflexi bacterium HGW-Chloroflexi-6]|nr:MAG: hypothetical protein CVU44_01615 [Chloroflexi bacterium HGW-Chloroflexi-6]